MNQMTLAALVVLLALPAAAQVPDAPETKSEPTPAEAAADAVAALATAQSLAFAGKIDELPADDGGGGGAVIIMGGGGSGQPFTGRFRVLRSGVETVIASERKLPGVTSFDDGDRTVVRATYEETPIDAARLTGELPQLLDFRRLAGAVRRSKSVKSKQNGDGSLVYTIELSKRFVAGASGVKAMMSPRILSLGARVTADANGRVTALRFTVLRSDPMAGVRRRALEGDYGGGAVTMTAGEEGEDEPGDTTVFELTPMKVEDARTLRALAAEFREMIG